MVATDDDLAQVELLTDVDNGISVGLYSYLWQKNSRGKPCPDVNIPHTVVFSDGKPRVWYFSSGKERCIMRKKRNNINHANIVDAVAPATKADLAAEAAAAAAAAAEAAAKASAIGFVQPALPGFGAPGADAASSTLAFGGGASHGVGLGSVLGGTSSRPSTRATPRVSERTAAAAYAGVPQLTELELAPGQHTGNGASTGNALGPWPHHGIVARFQGTMTVPNTNRSKAVLRLKKGTTMEVQDERVDWFTRAQLLELLPPGHHPMGPALHDGVLQRFVEPRGQHDFVLRATWSPTACMVERRTSKAKLCDPRLAITERVCTWEGPNWLTEQLQVTGSTIQGHIQRACDAVADHIADVSNGCLSVLRMVLNFKVDEANRVWLTHCSTLRLAGRHTPHRLNSGLIAAGAALSEPGPGRTSIALRDPTSAAHLPGGPAAAAAAPAEPARQAISTPSSPSLTPTPAAGSPPVSPSKQRAQQQPAVGYPASTAAAVAAMAGQRRYSYSPTYGAGSGMLNTALLGGPINLDLPAPDPDFKAAKAEAGSHDSATAFMCVLSGDMHPSSSRCVVTFKQLLQHWFSHASLLVDEAERLRSMDTIPPAIRRADPTLTRDYYLRVRGQPDFLYRTAAVCSAAAGEITMHVLHELERPGAALRPVRTGAGAGAAASGGSHSSGGGASHASAAAASRRHGSAPATPQAASTSAPSFTSAAGGSPYHTAHSPMRAAMAPRPATSHAASSAHATAPTTPDAGSRPSTGASGAASRRSRSASASHIMATNRAMAPSAMQLLHMRHEAALRKQAQQQVQQQRHAAAVAAAAAAHGPGNRRYSAPVYGSPDDSAGSSPASTLPTMLVPRTNNYLPGSPTASGGSPLHPSRHSPSRYSQQQQQQPHLLVAYAPSPQQMEVAAAMVAVHVADAVSPPSASPSRRRAGLPLAPGAGPGPTPDMPPPPTAAYTGGGSVTRASSSPPRSGGTALHTIHEEGTVGTVSSNGHGASDDADGSATDRSGRGGAMPPSPSGRPPAAPRASSGRMASSSPSGSRRISAAAGGGPYLPAAPMSVAHRSMSESGELPLIPSYGYGAGGGGGYGSLNASMASNASAASRMSIQNLISNDDIKTLRELSEAYNQAEALTQQLLAQAHEILSDPPGAAAAGGAPPGSSSSSRPAPKAPDRSPGGSRRSAPSGSGAPPPTRRSSTGRVSSAQRSGHVPSPLGHGSSSSNGMAAPQRRDSSSSGAMPLGRSYSQASAGAAPLSTASSLPRVGSGAALQEGQANNSCGSGAVQQGHIDVLTSAEQDLLAEALREP